MSPPNNRQITQDLGLVAAIISSLTPPENTKVIWYNETDSLHYYYDVLLKSWELLSGAVSSRKLKKLNKEWFSGNSNGNYILHEAAYDIISVYTLDSTLTTHTGIVNGTGALYPATYQLDPDAQKLVVLSFDGTTPNGVYVSYYPLNGDGGYVSSQAPQLIAGQLQGSDTLVPSPLASMSYNTITWPVERRYSTFPVKFEHPITGIWLSGVFNTNTGKDEVTFNNLPAGEYGLGTDRPMRARLEGSNPLVFCVAPNKITVANPPGLTTPAITISDPGTKKVGDPNFQLVASSTNTVTPLTYTSSNQAVATVNSAGVISLIGAGTTALTVNQAAGNGYASGSSSLTFTVQTVPTPQIVFQNPPTKTVGDGNFQLSASSNNTVTPLTYASGNTAVATVTSSGVVTLVAAGTATLTVNQAAGNGYTAGSATATLTVQAAPVPVVYDNTVSGGNTLKGVTLGAIEADTLEFNNFTGDTSNNSPATMEFWLNNTQVASVPFYAYYSGATCRYKHLNVTYTKTFTNGRVDL